MLFVAIVAWAPGLGLAVDFALTGFGTIGFAIADQDLRYLRFIDNDGTFKTDSIVGVQIEARFSNEWGATVQAVGSASRTSDDDYEAKIRWAFLSYRPSNDWLIRVGRVRPPVLINTQNAEVGVTYDVARLPAEVYTLSPVYDFDGGAVTKTWTFDNAELALDAYWGKTQIRYRLPFQRSPTSTQVFQSIGFPTDGYVHEDVNTKGVILAHTSGPLLLRGGVNIMHGCGLIHLSPRLSRRRRSPLRPRSEASCTSLSIRRTALTLRSSPWELNGMQTRGELRVNMGSESPMTRSSARRARAVMSPWHAHSRTGHRM